jgi:hypothetical protein
VKLREMILAVRQLETMGERIARVPMLVGAIGDTLDAVEGRLRHIGDCRGLALELTDVTQRAGGTWLSRTAAINGLGDVAPLLEQMSGAVGRVWDAVGSLRGDVDDAARSCATFERRFIAAANLDRLDVLADVLDTLQGVVGDLDEWGPPGPPATKAKRVAAAA